MTSPETSVPEPVPRPRALLLVAVGLGTAGLAVCLGHRGLEPFATWLYPFAWYPLLLALEGMVALRHRRFLLLGRPRTALAVLAWSVPAWMLWEILNFRLQNWHYVFVPEARAALWTGVTLSFATVLPACFLPAALLVPREGRAGPMEGPPDRRAGDGAGGGADGAWPTLADPELLTIRAAGVLVLVLMVLWPRAFFPLAWGVVPLVLEPDVYRDDPSGSLLADAARGRWERIGALLGGGALAGLAWEGLNAVARAGWIYTIPGLEELKLFEMPVPGFLGFPPLALSCFSLYRWLVGRGVAPPMDLVDVGAARRPAAGAPAGGLRRAQGAAAAGALLVVVGLLGMEAWTVGSRSPRLRDLPGILPSEVETLVAWGVASPFDLAGTEPEALARRVPGVAVARAGEWVGSARLATLRGMGTRAARHLHSWGVRSPEELARSDPEVLARCFDGDGAPSVGVARIRVWWRGARESAGPVPRSGT